MNTLQTHFWAVRDYLAPVLRESKFKEHGRITPEEFVAAGDFLAYKFPTWSWSAASSSDSKYTREFLPVNKQYLISRGVPCLRRVSQMERAALGTKTVRSAESSTSTDEKVLNFNEGHFGDEVSGKGGEDDWLATHLDDEPTAAHVADIEDMPDADLPSGASNLTAGEEDDLAARVAKTSFGETSVGQSSNSGAAREEGDEEKGMVEIGDIPDIDDEEDDELGGLGAGVVEAEDPATLQSRQAVIDNRSKSGAQKNRLVSVRTYDCLITYDKYYQTPRMWLVGYNESGQPLKPSEIFEDISSDYAQKTVTVEPFPHGNMSTASIHPCKHASVMRKVIERMNAGVVAEQQKVKAAAASGSEGGDKKKKKGWSLGGMKKSSGKSSNTADAVVTPPTTSDTGEEEGSAAGEIEVEGLRVDQYLLIFLKFMASIVPAIELDATQAF